MTYIQLAEKLHEIMHLADSTKLKSNPKVTRKYLWDRLFQTVREAYDNGWEDDEVDDFMAGKIDEEFCLQL